jgi:hypothetical protein
LEIIYAVQVIEHFAEGNQEQMNELDDEDHNKDVRYLKQTISNKKIEIKIVTNLVKLDTNIYTIKYSMLFDQLNLPLTVYIFAMLWYVMYALNLIIVKQVIDILV